MITSSQKDTVNESMVSHFNAEGELEIEVSESVDPCRAKPVSVLSVVNPPHTTLTTEHTEAASRHTENTEFRSPYSHIPCVL